MRKRVLQTVLISGLIAAQVVLQFPTVVYAESGEEVQTEVASTSGATEETSSSTEGTSGADQSTSGSTEGTSGSTEGTSGSTEGTSGSSEGTSGATEGTNGSTNVSAEGSESNEATGGTTTEGSESESSDSNEANTGESSESSEGTSGSVGENSGDTSDTSETGSSESAELIYKVTFKDSLDETFEVVVEVEENASAEAPEAPEHEGYAFVEWDADFSSVTEDMTVTAQYEEVVATPVLRSPLRSPAGGTSPAFNQTYNIYDKGSYGNDLSFDSVTIEAAEGVIPDGAYFTVGVSPNQSEIYNSMVAKYKSDDTALRDCVVNSITLFDDTGAEIQPNGSVTITIKNNRPFHNLGEKKYIRAVAFYADDTNNFIELSCTDDGEGTVSFETDHFSDYGVAYIDEYYIVSFIHGKKPQKGVTKIQKGSPYYLVVSDAEPTVGYTFDGWFKNEDCTIPFDKSERVTSDMNVYAKWFPKNYTIIYEPEGGQPVASVVIPYGEKIVPWRTTTKEGLTFGGWFVHWGYLIESFTENSVVTRVNEATSSMTLYAEWYAAVKYETNGGVRMSGIDVTPGNTIRPWKTTTKEGFVFDGWYRDAGLTQPFTSTDVVTSNMTLYAKWKENTCTVTFDSKGGSPVPSSRVQKGATYMTMPADPTKADATFVGWYKDEDCMIPFDNSEAINSDMTLYAKWRQNTYSVTYVVPSYFDTYLRFEPTFTLNSGNRVISINNGDVAYKPVNINDVDERGVYTDLASYMTFDSASHSWTVKEIPQVGYTDPHPAYNLKFYGWYKDAAFTIPYDFTEPVTEDITLYAKAEKTPLAFGTVIDLYFDYGYNESNQKLRETQGRWQPDTSWNSSHLTKKKVYYSKWVEDPDPAQMVRIPSPFSSRAAVSTQGVDSGYKLYRNWQYSEQIAPDGYLAVSQMYPGTVAVLVRWFFRDDSNPVPPTTPVQPSNPTPTPSDDPTPAPSEDPTPSVSPTPSVEPTETPSPTVSPSVSPAPSATPSPTVKPSAKPTQKPDSEDDEEDESGVLSSKHEVMNLIAEEVKEGSLTYVESDQFGFSRAYTLRSLNLDGKVKRVVNTKEI